MSGVIIWKINHRVGLKTVALELGLQAKRTVMIIFSTGNVLKVNNSSGAGKCQMGLTRRSKYHRYSIDTVGGNS